MEFQSVVFMLFSFSENLESEGEAGHEADALGTHAVEDVVAAVQQVVSLEPQIDGAV